MAYKPRSGLLLPTMWASIITGGLTGTAFVSETYIGSPYGSRLGGLLGLNVPIAELALTWAVLFLPGAFFGFIAVWPLSLVAAEWAARQEIAHPEFHRMHWPLTGALLGGPALFLYSFPLGLGQALLGQLVANGTVIGLGCACMTRLFIRRNVIDATVPADGE